MNTIYAVLPLLLIANFTHADIQTKIVGGVEVEPNSQIAKNTVFVSGVEPKRSFSCTGSILSTDLILTAAHCTGLTDQAVLTVHFGVRHDDSGPNIEVVEHHRHPGYVDSLSPQPAHDLAILKLVHPIPPGFEPVELLENPKTLVPGLLLTLAGYGRNLAVDHGEIESGVGVLREVQQTILQTDFTSSSDFLVDIHQQGSCHGDSGGPAFLTVQGKRVLAGTVSHLTDKDLLPPQGGSHNSQYACLVDMVYTSIPAHLEWIRAAINGPGLYSLGSRSELPSCYPNPIAPDTENSGY